MHAHFIILLKDINLKSPKQGELFQHQFIKNNSLNNILVGVVPLRELIKFLSDIFLGVWQHIYSLATYFRPAKSLIRRVLSPRGRPAKSRLIILDQHPLQMNHFRIVGRIYVYKYMQFMV